MQLDFFVSFLFVVVLSSLVLSFLLVVLLCWLLRGH